MEQLESDPKSSQDPVPSLGPGFMVPMLWGRRRVLGSANQQSQECGDCVKKEKARGSKEVKEGAWEMRQEGGEFSFEGPISWRYDKSRKEDLPQVCSSLQCHKVNTFLLFVFRSRNTT